MEQSDGRISNLPAFCFLERGQWKEKEYEIRGGKKKGTTDPSWKDVEEQSVCSGRGWSISQLTLSALGVFPEQTVQLDWIYAVPVRCQLPLPRLAHELFVPYGMQERPHSLL